jgi:O-antigen ligase
MTALPDSTETSTGRSAAPTAGMKTNSYVQQTMQNRMLLVVLAMVVLVPILASPSNPAWQNFANRALQFMTALLAGILVMRAKVATSKAEVISFFSVGPNLAITLYFIVSLISLSSGFSDHQAWIQAFSEFQRIGAGMLLYFALAYHVRRSEHLVKILDALVLVSLMLAILGMLTLGKSRGNTVLFGDHQLFGALLMILFPVPVVAAFTERDPKRQITAYVASAVTFICIIMTGTRTAWIGTFVAMIALALFSAIGGLRTKKGQRRDARQFIIPALTVFVLGLVFVKMSNGNVEGLLSERIGDTKDAIAYREHMWYAAERLILIKPVFGHGLGAYSRLQEPYSQSGRPGSVVTQNRPTLGEMAHNFWLQTAADQGLVGASLFAAIVISFLIAGVRRLIYMESGLRRTLLTACLSGIVGFSIDAIGNPAWQFAQVSMFFWLILGLGVASLRPRASRHFQ